MLLHRSRSLTPSEAAAALGRGELLLVDVREPDELAEARVEGGVIGWSRAGLPLASSASRRGAG
jgi:rhodanese-related sulfurtransferase